MLAPAFPNHLQFHKAHLSLLTTFRKNCEDCNIVSAKSILTITNYLERGPNVKEHGTIEPKKLVLEGDKSVPGLNRWGTECPTTTTAPPLAEEQMRAEGPALVS